MAVVSPDKFQLGLVILIECLPWVVRQTLSPPSRPAAIEFELRKRATGTDNREKDFGGENPLLYRYRSLAFIE